MINDVLVLGNILKTVASSVGSPIFTKKIRDTLISAEIKISALHVCIYQSIAERYKPYNYAVRFNLFETEKSVKR